MKKKSLLFVLISLFVISCQNKTEENKNQVVDLSANAQTVSEVLNTAEKNIDSLVTVKGTVTHTCRHSGKRCFIADSLENASIRVEATKKIGGFNQELVGSEIVVTGTLREKRLEKAYIDKWEAKTLKEKIEAEDGGKHCNTELANIKKMKDWMKKHNKNYYSVYYIEGNDFTEIY